VNVRREKFSKSQEKKGEGGRGPGARSERRDQTRKNKLRKDCCDSRKGGRGKVRFDALT